MNTINLLKPIPNTILPDNIAIRIAPVQEPLVCISNTLQGIIEFQPEYYRRGITGATKHIYVRETVSKMLQNAAHSLPSGYKLKIYDAWRPATVQKALFDNYYLTLRHSYTYKSKTEDELIRMAMQFVSLPSDDPNTPFVHATGGAVDLTIVDSNGIDLNMGTEFDDFSDSAHTSFFENHSNLIIRDNRRLLYNTMLSAGFTNYPAEWWHYDFGDRFWAAAKLQSSIYQGIYTNPIRNSDNL